MAGLICVSFLVFLVYSCTHTARNCGINHRPRESDPGGLPPPGPGMRPLQRSATTPSTTTAYHTTPSPRLLNEETPSVGPLSAAQPKPTPRPKPSASPAYARCAAINAMPFWPEATGSTKHQHSHALAGFHLNNWHDCVPDTRNITGKVFSRMVSLHAAHVCNRNTA